MFTTLKHQMYPPQHSPSFQGSCRLDRSTLDSYNLTRDFTYARRYIKPVPLSKSPYRDVNLAWVDELEQNIFTGLDHISTAASDADDAGVIDLSQCSGDALPMYLRQQEEPLDARGLVFGLSSTSERLLEFAPIMSHWLANTSAQLIAIVPAGPRVIELRSKFESLNIDATVLTSNDEFLANYFKLVEAFSAHRDEGSKWFTFIDDDTHYFSIDRFIKQLKIYDHNQEVYLGSVSEDLRQIRLDGLFAFGGAGVTVSRALLNRLHQEYYGCLSEQAGWEPGDVRLKRCIYQHTETKLTMIEGLHQVDLEGESSGIMEGPRPPINWHHYRSWSFQNVNLISLAGKICGSACLFQRWKFPVPTDFGYVYMTFHFGVSIIGYPVGIRPDLSRTEITWKELPGSNFDHSLAPLRMKLQEGRDRFTYRLLGVGQDVDGHVKHTYIKYADKEQQREKEERRSLFSSVDEVMELVFV
ncbi:hypothetical protein CBS101457_005640 [Exobasidium rhododendri]|nr:hypothetical protein CBS101457_005640 [Exobasidium rhododendri]